MNESLVGFAGILAPLLIGAGVAAVNANGVNDLTESAEGWIRRRQKLTSASRHWFPSYVLNPVLWMVVTFCDWTDGFSHRGLKSGTRIAATLYLIAIWLLVLYVAFAVAVAIVLLGAVLYALAQGLGESMGGSNQRGSSREPSRSQALDLAGLRGKKVYSGTSWFNEELEGRVDDEGNIYKGTSWISEEKVGRIDDDGNIYKGSSWMSEEKVGRIDKDGNLYKGSNWFTEERSGRIDKDGGIHEGTGWLNEKKKGRSGN